MTAYYVRSSATGSANGTSWANAYTTLSTAVSGKAAGDDFYVSDDHSESSTSVTLTFPGTKANPNRVFCVNHSGSVPPVSADLRTSAVVATSTGDITISGAYSIYGVQFKPGSSGRIIQSSLSGLASLKKCLLAPQGAGQIIVGGSSSGAKFRWIDTDVTFGSTSSGGFRLNTLLEMIGGSIGLTGSIPTNPPFNLGNGAFFNLSLDGVDLSGFGSGTTLMSSGGVGGRVVAQSCKTGAGVTLAATPTDVGGPLVDFINCDSGATNYLNERYRYEGTMTTETVIVRSGGATDGTTPVSHKIVTTANAKWLQPFEDFKFTIWNDTVGSPVVVTVYGICGDVSVPNNDDIWIDVEYLSDSATPKSSVATSGKSDGLAANTIVNSDASTWGGSVTPFKMQVTITPQQKGDIYITLKVAAVSKTYYIDPEPVLS